MTRLHKICFGILIVITIVSTTLAVTYKTKLNALDQTASVSQSIPDPVATAQIETLVQEIGAFIDLPQDEQPILATVSDPSKLKDQPFFAKAQLGDVVLIYQVSRKAILWRPDIKKVIEISAVTPPVSASTTPQ